MDLHLNKYWRIWRTCLKMDYRVLNWETQRSPLNPQTDWQPSGEKSKHWILSKLYRTPATLIRCCCPILRYGWKTDYITYPEFFSHSHGTQGVSSFWNSLLTMNCSAGSPCPQLLADWKMAGHWDPRNHGEYQMRIRLSAFIPDKCHTGNASMAFIPGERLQAFIPLISWFGAFGVDLGERL